MPVARDRAAAVTNEYLFQFRPLSGHKQECCRYAITNEYHGRAEEDGQG